MDQGQGRDDSYPNQSHLPRYELEDGSTSVYGSPPNGQHHDWFPYRRLPPPQPFSNPARPGTPKRTRSTWSQGSDPPYAKRPQPSKLDPVIDPALPVVAIASEVTTLVDDMELGDVEDVDVDEDEDDADGEEENEKDAEADNIAKFNVEEVVANMANIKLDDAQVVESIIADAVSDDEKRRLMLTQEDEDGMVAMLPNNQKAGKFLDKVEGNPDLRKGVSLFQERLSIVINRLVQFFLSVGHRENCHSLMQGWFLFCMANAAKESRDRLLRILTHESVISLPNQYMFGLDEWMTGMFDVMKRIDLEGTGNPLEFVTTYLGVAHCSDEDHVLYCGSATSLASNKPVMGEASRMADHRKMLAGGLEKVLDRRRNTVGCLYVHEKMAEAGKNSFFIPVVRFPVRKENPLARKAAALALFAENCFMILFSTVNEKQKARSGKHQEIATMSRLIVRGLRPKDFPTPCWGGANIVLPMLQKPLALWNLLHDLINKVEKTEHLMDTLRKYYAETGKPWLSKDVCRQILQDHNQKAGTKSNLALKSFYTEVLAEQKVEYLSFYRRYLIKLAILWVGIIGEVEEMGLLETCPTDDRRYTFSAEKLDWWQVSVRAFNAAPDHLKGVYSQENCKRLYKEPRSVFFNWKVLNKSNWDVLSRGLPGAFSTFRAKPGCPPVVKSRIVQICRHVLYKSMSDRAFLLDSDQDTVRLHHAAPTALTFLHEPVIKQLQDDVKRCDSISPEAGAWEDGSIKGYIGVELHVARNQLRAGIFRRTAAKWMELEKLDDDWAGPLSIYDKAPQQDIEPIQEDVPASRGTEPLDPSQIANFELLVDCHVDPVPVPSDSAVDGSDEAADGGGEAADGGGEAADGGGEAAGSGDEPFGLLDVDGQSAGKRLFTIRSRRPAAALPLDDPEATDLPPIPKPVYDSPWIPFVNNICPWCGVHVPKTHAASFQNHADSCQGRCNGCKKNNLTCKVPKSDGKSQKKDNPCTECVRTGGECIRPAVPNRGLYHAGVCLPCGKHFRKLHTHWKKCRGPCHTCREKKLECRRAEKEDEICQFCQTENLPCGGYRFADPDPKKTCDRCGNKVIDMSLHRKSCQEKCSSCERRKTACTRASSSSKGPCKQCKDAGIGKECDARWRRDPAAS
ncbi:hypothetical protein FDECE_16674 [Fusarium decemcellulare]|nr:hypothetical protein FDECE_16674 [Fusarium decemcellulare]